MTLHLRIPALLGALTLLALGGSCGQPAPTTSTLTGSIAQPSFASPVTKITVTNDKGQSTAAAVGAHGEFTIKLQKGATYQLFLSDDGKSTPIILNSDQGLVTSVHVKSGGASVGIGTVRFWGGDRSARSRLMTGLSTNECVNGVIAGSGKPCASGVAVATCADDDDSDSDSDENEVEHADDAADSNNVEHADSQSKVILADESQAMGVPEHNVAGDLGCDDDDDDEDSDEEEDD